MVSKQTLGFLVVAVVGCSDLQQAELPMQGGTISGGGVSSGDATSSDPVSGESMSSAASVDETTSSGGGTTLPVTATAGDEDSGTTSSGVTTSSDGDETQTRGEEGDSSSSSSTGACEPDGAGQWDNCATGEICGGDSTCLDLGAAVGTCNFACTSACDCPAAPGTGDAVVTCGDPGFGQGCFLSCQGGETCPDAMACIFGMCAYNNVVVVEDYGACDTQGWACSPGSLCVGTGTLSTCLPQNCNAISDCPVPLAGTVICDDANGRGGDECYIACSDDLTCPDDWQCAGGELCVQPNP